MPEHSRRSKPLPPEFFERDTLVVAEKLLGKYLVRKWRGREVVLPITETEAYDGPDDKASHARRGKTPRTTVMFGSAGYWYVYFTYGMHYLVNIVTGPAEYPAAVLIRGAGDIVGPARLTKHLHITKAHNKKPAVPASKLWVADRGVTVPKKEIERTPRIGVHYAEEWREKPYRFIWKGKGTQRS